MSVLPPRTARIPTNDIYPPDHRQSVRLGYVRCCAFEEAAMRSPERPSAKALSNVAAARLLGYLILEVSSTEGRETLSREITSCVDDVKLWDLGEFTQIRLIGTCELFLVLFPAQNESFCC